jgi:apolipoprotein D and lipocalin family protein
MFSKLFRRIRSGHVPQTVDQVDVAKYCGTWYEIASIPVRRQRGCSGTKAEYFLAPGGGSVYAGLLETAAMNGIDASKLVRTVQD